MGPKPGSGFQLILLTITLLSPVKSQSPITCSAGYYKPGQKATITCHYHGPIGTDENTGAYITWRQLEARQDSSGREVLMCHFSGGSVSVCDPEDGYRFISFDKNNLTIEVPDVSVDFQGRYSCGVVPAIGRDVFPCLLVVEGTPEPMRAPPENQEKNESLHKRVETIHGLVIFIFVIIFVIIGVAVALFLAYRNKWGPFRTTDKSQKPDQEKGIRMKELGDAKHIAEETATISAFASRSDVPAAPAEPEKEPLIRQDHDEAPVSARGDEGAAKGDGARETKPETEEERREKENREAAEEIHLVEKNIIDLKARLKTAKGDDKKNLEKQKKESEQRLKLLRSTLNKRKSQLEKDEKARKMREEKERKEREKNEKGKGK